jgi:hypothetical protein
MFHISERVNHDDEEKGLYNLKGLIG